MHTLLQFTRVVLFATLLVTAGCNRSPSRYAKQVAHVCPSGWQVSASSNVIVLRREAAVWIMGKVSNPPPMPDQSVADYFKSAGHEIHYEVRLRFVSLLPRHEYEAMKTAREQAAARLNKGASGKSEYGLLQRDYVHCQVPRFFTSDYSIFVDRWADRGTNSGYGIEPRFIDVYPPEAGPEVEAVIQSVSKVFKRYENPGT